MPWSSPNYNIILCRMIFLQQRVLPPHTSLLQSKTCIHLRSVCGRKTFPCAFSAHRTCHIPSYAPHELGRFSAIDTSHVFPCLTPHRFAKFAHAAFLGALKTDENVPRLILFFIRYDYKKCSHVVRMHLVFLVS